jgi:3-oxoacyl-[acyl-carrier-protein] synthase II
MSKRVVVTGMGAVTPLGLSVEASWEGLIAGKSAAATIRQFDATGLSVRIACELTGFNVEEYVDAREARKMDPSTQYGMAASLMAWKDSGLGDTEFDPNKVGVIIGSGVGGIQTSEAQHRVLIEKGPKRVSPFFIPMMIPDMTAGAVSITLGLKGPNYSTVSACASGAHAIGASFRAVQRGDAYAVVCGGTEAAVCPIAVGGFASMKAISARNDEPERASRPFDLDRDGFVLGEGAGVVVLEEFEGARARGATIYAEVVGYGATADAFHMTAPAPGGEGAARAMRAALDDGSVDPESVGYINAHGTSTPLNDKYETAAIKSVFGDHARKLAVSSTKSMVGHLLGAAGGVELIFTALALGKSVIPPTINYETPDPECDLDYTPNEPRETRTEYALTNSFGFGGHNAVLALRRFEG